MNPNIPRYVEGIRNATYGRDNRAPIANAIELTGCVSEGGPCEDIVQDFIAYVEGKQPVLNAVDSQIDDSVVAFVPELIPGPPLPPEENLIQFINIDAEAHLLAPTIVYQAPYLDASNASYFNGYLTIPDAEYNEKRINTFRMNDGESDDTVVGSTLKLLCEKWYVESVSGGYRAIYAYQHPAIADDMYILDILRKKEVG